jgi:hypothetical protein
MFEAVEVLKNTYKIKCRPTPLSHIPGSAYDIHTLYLINALYIFVQNVWQFHNLIIEILVYELVPNPFSTVSIEYITFYSNSFASNIVDVDAVSKGGMGSYTGGGGGG